MGSSHTLIDGGDLQDADGALPGHQFNNPLPTIPLNLFINAPRPELPSNMPSTYINSMGQMMLMMPNGVLIPAEVAYSGYYPPSTQYYEVQGSPTDGYMNMPSPIESFSPNGYMYHQPNCLYPPMMQHYTNANTLHFAQPPQYQYVSNKSTKSRAIPIRSAK